MKSRKWLWLVLAAVVIVCLGFFFSNQKITNYSEKYAGTDLDSDVTGVGRDNTYANYLQKYGDKPSAQEDLEIQLAEFINAEGVTLESEYEGRSQVLYTDEESIVEWEVEVPESGLYQIRLDYFPVDSRSVDIERCLYINGEVPFLGADSMAFSRLWADAGEVKKDNQGNDIRPSQVEVPEWTSAYCKDYMGYYTEPYMFYLEKGKNTIGLFILQSKN